MKTLFLTFLTVLAGAASIHATEFFVSTNGDDTNPGTAAAPFRTIQRAADVAMPGDTITVHAGIYRERINPPRGGTSDRKRITYQAAPGETVVITGSEMMKHWERVTNDTWKVVIPNSFFGKFNPYADVLHGDWFNAHGRQVHTGAVYLDGDWLIEAAHMDNELKPLHGTPQWFGMVTNTTTTLWAQFPGVNPNDHQVEINVRQTVFYPEKTGINYITVRGFTLEDAATPWAPPTAEQIGLIGPHWSKGWIIENNVIRYSICSGVSLGKYGDDWDNKSESAKGYVATIERALTNGWNSENVGHHLVRDNDISHCEQAGIVGSLGAAFSTITGNTIHEIHVRGTYGGLEMAGIKFHGAIDVIISHNHIYRCGGSGGLWLDWMAQGTRVSQNLFDKNGEDIFLEADHGPVLVDNNLLLSPVSLRMRSDGCAVVHNLFAGKLPISKYDPRQTPFLKPHSTALVGLHDLPCGDDRYYNNLFFGDENLSQYDGAKLPVWMDGDVFTSTARPSRFETNAIVEPDFAGGIVLTHKDDGWYLAIHLDPAWRAQRQRRLVTTRLLGKTVISHERFENRDGSALKINTDYFGEKRDQKNPFPGPFEISHGGTNIFKVW